MLPEEWVNLITGGEGQ